MPVFLARVLLDPPSPAVLTVLVCGAGTSGAACSNAVPCCSIEEDCIVPPEMDTPENFLNNGFCEAAESRTGKFRLPSRKIPRVGITGAVKGIARGILSKISMDGMNSVKNSLFRLLSSLKVMLFKPILEKYFPTPSFESTDTSNGRYRTPM